MAITDFEQCVINALRAITSAALQALKAALQAYITLLQVQLAALIAQAIPLEILRQQLIAQAALVAAANDALKNVSNLLPTGTVTGPCIQLSLFNLSIADRLAPVTSTLDELENDILMVASLLDLNAIQQRLIQELIETSNALIDAVDEVINEKIIEAAEAT